MYNKKKIYIIMTFVLVMIFASSCRPNNNEEINDNLEQEIDLQGEEKKEISVTKGGQIKLAMRNPKVLNPITNMDKTVDQTLNLVFEKLVALNEKDEIIPNIAKSWSRNEDGTVVDIVLTNMKWHDGKKVVADDVVYSIKSIQDAEDSPYKSVVKNIVSYRAMEDGSVRIVYKEGFSGYEYMLNFPIIPSHIENIDKSPIGTGPYKFEEWEPNHHLILSSNKEYFKGEPNIDTIKVLCTPESEADLYSFDQGIIDVVNTDIIDWEKYAKNKKSNIYEYNTLYYDYLGLNFNKGIFQDKLIRQSLIRGLNREQLLNKYYLGHGVVVDTPVSPASWLYDEESKIYEYDKELAKNSLKDKNINIRLLVSKENTQRIEVARAIKKMYQDIGVNIDIIEADEEAYMSKILSGDYDMFIGGWKFAAVPDLSFAFHSSMIGNGTNYINYNSEEMDSLLRRAFLSKDNEELKENYIKLQKNLANELPYISLYFKTAALITDDRIKGNIEPHHLNIYNGIHNWYLMTDKE